MNCLIVDDSNEVRESLGLMLKKYSFIELKHASNLLEAQSVLSNQKVDVIFLDIQLGNENGLSIFNLFSKFPPIVVISNYADYAVETYNFKYVRDYLVKPVQESRLLKAIGRAIAFKDLEDASLQKRFCFLHVSRKLTRFDFDAIDFIESSGAKCKIYSLGVFKVVNENMGNLEKILPSSDFRRVHKSIIINIRKITSINKKFIEIHTHKLPIGDKFREDLQGLFHL